MDENFYLIEEEKKFGFIDINGKIIIPPNYDYARSFSDGVAWVNIGGHRNPYDCEGGKWGFIDQQGNEIRSIDLELVRNTQFSEGFSWVMTGKNKYNGVWGIIDIEGGWIVEPKFDFSNAYAFDNGFSVVEKDRKKGFVNNEGELIIKPQYDSVSAFSEDNLAWVNIGAEEDYDGYLVGGRWGLIDINGEYIVDHMYDQVQNLYDGVRWAKESSIEGKWVLLNEKGQQISDFRYDMVFRYYGEEALVCSDLKWYFIDREGNMIRTLREDIQQIKSYDNKIAKIVINSNYGFINRAGELILEPDYKEIRDSEKAAWVKSDRNWNIFNKESYKLINFEIEFVSVENFIDNEARFWTKGNKCGLIDKNGKILASPLYHYVYYHRNGYSWVNIGGKWGYSGIRGGKWGVIDIEDNFITEPKFDGVWDFFGRELFDIKIGDKKGYANHKGEIIWLEK